jgi:hypothetical protein
MGSCLLPENIQPYVAPPAATHSPPVLQIYPSAEPPDAVKCLDGTNYNSTQFTIPVEDPDGIHGQTLTARWFLDYSELNPESTTPLTNAGVKDTLLSPYVRGDTVTYPPPLFNSAQLDLNPSNPQVYALEVVVSDQFDTTGADPPNRAAAPGYNVTSYKWVINYLGSGTCPQP